MPYKVIAPLVVAKQADGTNVHIYQGAPLPDSVDETEAARLLEGGFVEEIVTETPDESDDSGVEVPEGDPSEDWSNKQLDAYAAAKGIDIKAAKNKAEKLAAFAAASA